MKTNNNDNLFKFFKQIFNKGDLVYKTFVTKYNHNHDDTLSKKEGIRQPYNFIKNFINKNDYLSIKNFFNQLLSIYIDRTGDSTEDVIYAIDILYEYFESIQKNSKNSEQIEEIKKIAKLYKEKYINKQKQQEENCQNNEDTCKTNSTSTANDMLITLQKQNEITNYSITKTANKAITNLNFDKEHDYALFYLDKHHKGSDTSKHSIYRPDILCNVNTNTSTLTKTNSNYDKFVLLPNNIQNLKKYFPSFESSPFFFIEKSIFSPEHNKNRINITEDASPYIPIEVVFVEVSNIKELIKLLKEGNITHHSNTVQIILACEIDKIKKSFTGLYLQKDKDIKLEGGKIKLLPINFDEDNDSYKAHLCLKTIEINSSDILKFELYSGVKYFYKYIGIEENLSTTPIYTLQEYILQYLKSYKSKEAVESLSYYSKDKNNDINKILEVKLNNQLLASNAKKLFKVSDKDFRLECNTLLQASCVHNLINDFFSSEVIASVIVNDPNAFKIISDIVIDTIKQENSKKIQELKQEIDDLNNNKSTLLKEYNEQKKAFDKIKNNEIQLRNQIKKHNEIIQNQLANLKDNLYSTICDAMLKNELLNYFNQKANTHISNNKVLNLKNEQILDVVVIPNKKDAFTKLKTMLKNIGVKDHYTNELSLILLVAKACNIPIALCGPQAREIIDCISIFLQGTRAYYINLASCTNLDNIDLKKDNDINKPFLILDNFFINLRSQIHNVKTIFKDYFYCYVLAYKDDLLVEPKDIKSYALILNTQNIVYNCIDRNQSYYMTNQDLLESIEKSDPINFKKSDLEDKLKINNDISLSMLKQIITKANSYSNYFNAEPLDIDRVFEFLEKALI